MVREAFELPPEFIRQLECPPPPTYADHAPDECGACVHMRRSPAGVPLPANFEDDPVPDGTTKRPRLASEHPVVRQFYNGLGYCMLSPPVPGRIRVSVYPTTHVSWTCQFQTPRAGPAEARLQPKAR